MPFAFLIVGTIFIVAGLRGTQDTLFDLLHSDFAENTPDRPSFIPWLAAVIIIGSLGYIESLKKLSQAFLALILIVMFISNGGFFQKFTAGIYGPSREENRSKATTGKISGNTRVIK